MSRETDKPITLLIRPIGTDIGGPGPEVLGLRWKPNVVVSPGPAGITGTDFFF